MEREFDLMAQVAALREHVESIDRAMDKSAANESEQWEHINALRDRLPNWATLIITGQGIALGWFAHALYSCIK